MRTSRPLAAGVLDHLADRIVERDDLLDGGGDLLDAPLVEAQAVEQRVAQARLRAGLHVLGVGGEHVVDPRAQRLGERHERSVLVRAVQGRQLASRALGRRQTSATAETVVAISTRG